MTVKPSERGTALLTVLLLVAVIATIASTALDRIGIATRLAANVSTIGQSRAWLATAESLAMTRIDDLLAAQPDRTTLAGNWLGVERSIALPDGAVVRARLTDGSNCFNLNSLVEERGGTSLVARPAGAAQFTSLMTLLGIEPGEAARIAASATDFIDSDSVAHPLGAEDGGGGGALPANRLIADASELGSVAGVASRHLRLLRRWLCALPTTDLSPLNINTLLPEQAPLLAMLAPATIDLARARAQLDSRPAQGFASILEFWNSAAFKGAVVAPEASRQVKLRSAFFALEAQVASGNVELAQTVLVDARQAPVRPVRRQFGEAG